MSYRNGISYLGTKTKVVELCNQFGGRVAVCPEWNGRVMSSTSDGLDGNSFGMINVASINAGADDPSFDFYGGEDQLTLSPEGGPFSLYHSTGPRDQFVAAPSSPDYSNGFSEGPFHVDSVPPDPEIRMRRSVRLTNLAGARFDLDIVRTIRLLSMQEIVSIFGDGLAVSLEQSDVSFVGFASINSLVNCGQAHSKSSGLVSIRTRSMYNSGASTVAIVPFRRGNDEDLGPAFCADFFGMSPHGRLRVLPEAALLRADSKFRCRIGLSRKRALPRIGSIDFREGILTLVAFDMPERPWEYDYLSNEYCDTVARAVPDFVSAREFHLRSPADREVGEAGARHEENPTNCCSRDRLYAGEVVRAYNHGPSVPGEILSSFFYEFDVFSPARELVRGGTLKHHQYTLHVNADNRTLEYLVRNLLHVEYGQVFEKMMI